MKVLLVEGGSKIVGHLRDAVHAMPSSPLMIDSALTLGDAREKLTSGTYDAVIVDAMAPAWLKQELERASPAPVLSNVDQALPMTGGSREFAFALLGFIADHKAGLVVAGTQAVIDEMREVSQR